MRLAAFEHLKNIVSPGSLCNLNSFKYLQITRTGIIACVFEFIPDHGFKFGVTYN